MIERIDHGQVRELRLARPPANALNLTLLRQLLAELEAAAHAGARAVVLSGQPGLFSAGLDAGEFVRATAGSLQQLITTFFAVQRALAGGATPVVAAITGHCPAGGTVLAMFCDHRVMASGAYRIGLNEVQVGLYPGKRIFQAYARLLGVARAANLLSRGAMLDPDGALRIGLVDELAEPAAVIPRALAIAQQLVQLPPEAYRRTRELVRADLLAILDAPDDLSAATQSGPAITEETLRQMGRILRKDS